MSWTFYEIEEHGANSAVISFQEGVTRLIGDYAAQNLLKKYCYYKRGSGHSMVENFKFIPATAYTRDDKTVDLNKLETDYIRNGRTAEDLAEYLSKITQLRTQRFRMQVYPTTHIVESDPINMNDAILAGDGDTNRGLAVLTGEDAFVLPMLASETHENNKSFVTALQNVVTNGITFKKTRWDGGINEDGDSNDLTVALPEYCKYTTVNEGYLSVSDLIKIRAQMQNNMTDAPELMRPLLMLMSPNTAANFIQNNSDRSDLLNMAVFGDKGTANGQPSLLGGLSPFGFTFDTHAYIPDNQCFVIVPGVTMGVYDWGTLTQCKEDADVWSTYTTRRRPNYGVKVTQPLSFLSVTINGLTDEYTDDRMDDLVTTSDEALKPIRDTSSTSDSE